MDEKRGAVSMHRTIDFPNLGIHLKSVGDHITVFGFDIAYYGIVIGIGILAGLMMAVMEAKRTHKNIEDYYDLAIYGVIFSIIGARAYYVIFSWDMYKDDIKSIINIREGGLAIYGGVITAIVVVFIFGHLKNKTNEEIVEEEVKEIEKKKVRIPWYVIGFFVTCALFSLKVIPVNVSHVCKTISNNLEIIALAAIGLRVNVKELLKQGKAVSLYALGVGSLQIVAAIVLIFILVR